MAEATKTLAELPDALRELELAVRQNEADARRYADFVSGTEPEKPVDGPPEAPVTNLRADVWKRVMTLACTVARTGSQLDRLEKGLGLGRATDGKELHAPLGEPFVLPEPERITLDKALRMAREKVRQLEALEGGQALRSAIEE